MCGRFAMELAPDKLQKKLEDYGFKIEIIKNDDRVRSGWNKAPQSCSMIYNVNNKVPQLAAMKWTLQPSYAKAPVEYPSFNTRSESLNPLKTSWKCALSKRGILCMRGYYEWHTKDRQPYYMSSTDDNLLFCLVIWDFNSALGDIPTFSIVTKASSADLNHIHPRMPVIVDKEAAKEWVHGDWPDVLRLIEKTKELNSWQVSRDVNKVGIDKQELTYPVRKTKSDIKITDFFLGVKRASSQTDENIPKDDKESTIQKKRKRES